MKLKAVAKSKYYQELKDELSVMTDKNARFDFLNNLRKSLNHFKEQKQKQEFSTLWTLRNWQRDMQNNIEAIQEVINELQTELFPQLYA